MRHIDFEGRNKILMPGVGQRDVQALHVRETEHPVHGKMVMSVWEPTPEERQIIATGGVILLHVRGTTHPPLVLTASVVDRRDEVAS